MHPSGGKARFKPCATWRNWILQYKSVLGSFLRVKQELSPRWSPHEGGHNNYLVHKLKLRNPKLCEARLPREKENITELNTTSSTTTRSGSSSRLATLLTTTMASSPGRSYNNFYVFIVHSPFFCKGCVSFCFISTGTVEGPAPSILRWIRSQSFCRIRHRLLLIEIKTVVFKNNFTLIVDSFNFSA